MKQINEFKGLSKSQKKELKKNYIKSEWKQLLISYFFIILSSSKPFFSSKNGAIFVLIWFTLAILLSVYTYVSQSDYMNSKKKAMKYSKKKHAKVEKGLIFFPEIGGWTFIGMQVLSAILVYMVAVPVSLYLQFKNLEIYKEVYMKLLIGILADTYIVAFFNVILQILIEFIYDCAYDRTTLKKTVFTLKLKNVICYVGTIIILCIAFTYYFNKEFEGLFGDMARKIVGSIYIIFMLYPLIKCIKQVIDSKKQGR